MISIFRFLALSAVMTLMASCSILEPVRSLADVATRDETPKNSAVEVAHSLTKALTDVTLVCENDGLSDDGKAVVREHGDILVRIATDYFASAEFCRVVNGKLTSEPGGECYRGNVRNVGASLPGKFSEMALDMGLGTAEGLALFTISRAASRLVDNMDGGSVDGFLTDDTLTREQYLEALQPIRTAHAALAACVAEG